MIKMVIRSVIQLLGGKHFEVLVGVLDKMPASMVGSCTILLYLLGFNVGFNIGFKAEADEKEGEFLCKGFT